MYGNSLLWLLKCTVPFLQNIQYKFGEFNIQILQNLNSFGKPETAKASISTDKQ